MQGTKRLIWIFSAKKSKILKTKFYLSGSTSDFSDISNIYIFYVSVFEFFLLDRVLFKAMMRSHVDGQKPKKKYSSDAWSRKKRSVAPHVGFTHADIFFVLIMKPACDDVYNILLVLRYVTILRAPGQPLIGPSFLVKSPRSIEGIHWLLHNNVKCLTHKSWQLSVNVWRKYIAPPKYIGQRYMHFLTGSLSV